MDLPVSLDKKKGTDGSLNNSFPKTWKITFTLSKIAGAKGDPTQSLGLARKMILMDCRNRRNL